MVAAGTGLSLSLGAMPREVELASTSAFTLPACTSSQATTLEPGRDAASCSARSRLRLVISTLAPLSAAPNASARPAPPAPRTRNVLPARGDDPLLPLPLLLVPELDSWRSMASMAAHQSVLYPLKLPSGCLMRVLTAPIFAATGSTCLAALRAASLWGMVTEKPWKSGWPAKASRKRGRSSTSSGTYTPSWPMCWNAVLWMRGDLE
mmetsp:Transcript_8384/g.20892  ORF Transcript_8384/g.20892 Transcript_8384/m.20892 type:complete len:207 (+) Transcript_8384:444-1064(+)